MSEEQTKQDTVFINETEYVYCELSEKAQVSYQQLISLRNQLAELGMKRDQLGAAQSVFENVLQEEIDPDKKEQPTEG